jgi:hypothetical protein
MSACLEKFCRFAKIKAFAIAFGISIAFGASAWAGEATDAFVPIQDSTSKDPAGMQLMIVSIGILVTMVLAIFTVTMVYMIKGGKKKSRPPQSESAD